MEKKKQLALFVFSEQSVMTAKMRVASWIFPDGRIQHVALFYRHDHQKQ